MPTTLMMSDQLDQWMTAARDQDDQEAFAQVVEACHHVVRSSVLRDTADADLADEIAQEALVRAWERRQQYRPGTSPRAWLLAIARSQVIEQHRRRGRDRRHMRDLVHHELLRHVQEDSLDPLGNARIHALQHCVEQLSADQQTLLDMIHGRGLSCEDAAIELGIKAPACRQRLSRLHRTLRKCAEDRLKEAQP